MTPERELQLVLQERDRTFALMLERIETLEAERDEARAGNHSANEHEPTWAQLCDYWKARALAAETKVADEQKSALKSPDIFGADNGG